MFGTLNVTLNFTVVKESSRSLRLIMMSVASVNITYYKNNLSSNLPCIQYVKVREGLETHHVTLCAHL